MIRTNRLLLAARRGPVSARSASPEPADVESDISEPASAEPGLAEPASENLLEYGPEIIELTGIETGPLEIHPDPLRVGPRAVTVRDRLPRFAVLIVQRALLLIL